MAGLHCVVVVVSVDVEKGEVARIDPSSSLYHKLLMRFHRICVCYSVRHVLKIVFSILLTIDA